MAFIEGGVDAVTQVLQILIDLLVKGVSQRLPQFGLILPHSDHEVPSACHTRGGDLFLAADRVAQDDRVLPVD